MTANEMLAAALSKAPLDLTVRANSNRVHVKAKAMPAVTLRGVSAGEGWPSDVRQVLRDVGPKWPIDLVAVAPRFSPGAVRRLLAAGANWADSAGDVRIVRPPLHIYGFTNSAQALETLPLPTTLKWNRSLTDITEWLLIRPGAEVGVTDVARATGWSPALGSRAMRTLQRHGWLTAHGSGPTLKRTISNPGSLLEAWSAGVAARPPRRRQGHVLMPSPASFIREGITSLLEGAPYALTGWAAASVLAPFAGTIPSVQVYVDSVGLAMLWERWLDSPNPPVRPVEEGANLVLLEAGEHILRHTSVRDRLQLASSPRVYADLLPLGGRAADAAAHLREVAIGF